MKYVTFLNYLYFSQLFIVNIVFKFCPVLIFNTILKNVKTMTVYL